MARIRTVKPEFWTDETMADLPRDVRLLFLGLLNHVDDSGRCVDNERLIKAAVFPLDDDVPSSTVRRWLDDLSTTRRVVLYEVAGRRYLQVANFTKHQKIDRPKESVLPHPDDGRIVDITPGQSTFVDASTNDRRSIDDASLLYRDQGKDQGTGTREQGPLPASEASTNALVLLDHHAVAVAPAARTRDIVFDALCEACGWDPTGLTKSAARAAGVAASEIRKAFNGTPAELVEEIAHRRNAYIRIYSHAALTPSALAKNWAGCTEQAVRMADPSARKQFARAATNDSGAHKERIRAHIDGRQR